MNSKPCGETKRIPKCCPTCGNYKPQFYRVMHKECAVFTTLDRIVGDTCGAWCPRPEPPKA